MLAEGTEAPIGGSHGTGTQRIGIYINEFRMRVAGRGIMTRISGDQRVKNRHE